MHTKQHQKPMRTVWHSLLWKEWHEHKWKLVSLAAILVAMLALFVFDDVRSTLLGVSASLIAYGILAGGFIGMHAAAGENTRGTMSLLRSQPTRMWQVAIVKLLVALVTVAIPVVAVVLVAVAIMNSNWIDPTTLRQALDWEAQCFPLCWGITDWATSRIVGGVLGTCSLLLWMAAIGVNRSDEIRAGAIGFLVVAMIWLTLGYSLNYADNINDDKVNSSWLEHGIYILMTVAPGGPAFVDADGSTWWGTYSVVGHGWVLFWYLHKYGRAATKPARYVNDSRANLQTVNAILPPFKSPFRAIAWKQFRETAPLVVAAASMVIAMIGLFFAFGHERFSWDSAGSVLGGITITVAFLVTMVAGIGVYLEDLKPQVHNFWRSRPLNLRMWFGVKFVTGWLVLAITFGLLFLLAAAMNPGLLTGRIGQQAEFTFFAWLLTLIYTLAMGTYCLVRQPLYAAAITLGILFGGGMISGMLLDDVRPSWFVAASLMLVAQAAATAVAWLALKNNWGWHK